MICPHTMEELSIEITYKCPMECIHCSSRASLKNETLIPKEKIIEMIDDCKENCGTTDVSLSGGEPFEHPDFWEIMDHIKKNKLTSIVYSCGIEKKNDIYLPFCDERIKKLKNKCDKLIISMHGIPDTHNKILSIGNNAFFCCTETIKKAVDAGIRVEIHFVPTKINYKQLLMVYGICSLLGVSKMSILRYVPQGRGLETSEKNGEINLNKEEFYEMQIDMNYLKNLTRNSNGLFTPDFRIGIPADFTFLIEFFLEGKLNIKKERACTGGKTKILVKADGLVQVCPAWKELDHLSAGNIYQENVSEIWKNGHTYEEFRKFMYTELEEPCKSCIFVESCMGGCAAQRILINNSKIEDLKFAPDPLCFYPDFSKGIIMKKNNAIEWEDDNEY